MVRLPQGYSQADRKKTRAKVERADGVIGVDSAPTQRPQGRPVVWDLGRSPHARRVRRFEERRNPHHPLFSPRPQHKRPRPRRRTASAPPASRRRTARRGRTRWGVISPGATVPAARRDITHQQSSCPPAPVAGLPSSSDLAVSRSATQTVVTGPSMRRAGGPTDSVWDPAAARAGREARLDAGRRSGWATGRGSGPRSCSTRPTPAGCAHGGSTGRVP